MNRSVIDDCCHEVDVDTVTVAVIDTIRNLAFGAVDIDAGREHAGDRAMIGDCRRPVRTDTGAVAAGDTGTRGIGHGDIGILAGIDAVAVAGDQTGRVVDRAGRRVLELDAVGLGHLVAAAAAVDRAAIGDVADAADADAIVHQGKDVAGIGYGRDEVDSAAGEIDRLASGRGDRAAIGHRHLAVDNRAGLDLDGVIIGLDRAVVDDRGGKRGADACFEPDGTTAARGVFDRAIVGYGRAVRRAVETDTLRIGGNAENTGQFDRQGIGTNHIETGGAGRGSSNSRIGHRKLDVRDK